MVVSAAGVTPDLEARGVDVDELLTVPVAMFVFRDPDGNRLELVAGN